MGDAFNLDRYLRAQEPLMTTVENELSSGQKRSHWMWFIFPQVQGLGTSPMAQRFAIGSLAEARAYLAHPVLGTRLRRCTQLVLDISGNSASRIFGYPDDMKFRSSMTLFDRVEPNSLFASSLERYFDGERDQATLRFLDRP